MSQDQVRDKQSQSRKSSSRKSTGRAKPPPPPDPKAPNSQHPLIRALKNFAPLIKRIKVAHFIRYPRADRWATPAGRPFKFVNTTMRAYRSILADLLKILKEQELTKEEYDRLMLKLDEIEETEARICECILELLVCYNVSMEQFVQELKQLLQDVMALPDMANNHSPKQISDYLDKYAVAVYDFARFIDKKHDRLWDLARTYHIPYYYDTDDGAIPLREDVLKTYKRICAVKRDFFIATEALWSIRHAEYGEPFALVQCPKPAKDDGGKSKVITTSDDGGPPPSKSEFKSNEASETEDGDEDTDTFDFMETAGGGKMDNDESRRVVKRTFDNT